MSGIADNDEEFVVEKVTMEVEIKVPKEDWIDFLIKYSDIFGHDYIGYWGYGYPLKVRDERIGWIVVEYNDDEDSGDCEKRGEGAVRCFRDRLPLPERCHLLDKAAAIKAYVEGCKKWGPNWFEEKGDANTYDVVLQLALLGEIRYG